MIAGIDGELRRSKKTKMKYFFWVVDFC